MDSEILQGRIFGGGAIFLAFSFFAIAVMDAERYANLGWIAAFSGWWIAGVSCIVIGNLRAKIVKETTHDL